MTLPPWLVLALVSALALALLYGLLTGRVGWRVVTYWVIILAGLLTAEMAAESLGWNMTRLGDLRLAPDSAGALIAVGLLRVLGL